MKIGSKLFLTAVAAIGMSLGAARAQAAATITMLGDSGSRVTTVGSTTSTSSVSSPYGTPPAPVITQLTAGVEADFTLSSDFFAVAHSLPNGQTMDFDGKVTFYVDFQTASQLTVNLFEDGGWTKTGTGVVGATAIVNITPVDTLTRAILGDASGNSTTNITLNPLGTWKLTDQVTATGGPFKSYKVVIDNKLFAQALTPGSDAFIAKKDFTLILTTDGSTGGGNIPEPASIGVLAIGAMALLARRRRA